MPDDEDVFPGNSHRKKTPPDEREPVERITKDEPIRRKKPLGRRIKDVFIGGNPKTTLTFIVQSVLVPAAKEMIIEAGREGIEKLVRGDSYQRRQRPDRDSRGYVAYNRMGTPPPQQRAIGRPARGRHTFDDIVLQDRREAELVIERMFDIVNQYTTASVADLYELVGLRPDHVDNKWGWADMRGAGVVQVREGYLLELPDVIPLEM